MELNKITSDVVDVHELSTALRSNLAAGGVMDYINSSTSTTFNHSSYLDTAQYGTQYCQDTAMAMDASGNIYWALVTDVAGATNCKLLKISPTGEILYTYTVISPQATSTALVVDPGGPVYWAIANYSALSGSPATSTVYRYNPTSGATNLYWSETVIGSYGTALAYVNGSLYWALSFGGTTSDSGMCYTFRLTGITGTTAQYHVLYASQTGHLAMRTSLLGVGTSIFWAITNTWNGTTSTLPCSIYNITSAIAPSASPAFAANTAPALVTRTMISAVDISMVHQAGYIHWATACGNEHTTSQQNQCHLYRTRISDGATHISGERWFDHAVSTSVAIDPTGILYWAICSAMDSTGSDSTYAQVFAVDPATRAVVPIAVRSASAPVAVRMWLNTVQDALNGLAPGDLFMALAHGGWGDSSGAANSTISRFNRIVQD